MLTRLFTFAAVVAAVGCGDDAIVVNDDGVSSGGVKLDTIDPERGSINGGQAVLLQGEGLGGNNVVVAFGDITAEDVEILSASALLVVTPPGVDPGAVDVLVANAQGFAQRNAGFTYNDRPTIASVSPAAGPRIGGDTVVISGSGFQDFEAGENFVTFAGEPAAVVSVDSDSEITVTTPPGTPGGADVEVTNTNGSAVGPELYVYEANGLFAAAGDPTDCRGSNNHSNAGPQFVFIDLDDNSVLDIGVDDAQGFNKIAPDGEGGLVGLQACTQDLMQVDLQGGAPSLIVDTNRLPGGRRHMGGLARDGNDYIVRSPVDTSQFARLSTSTGDITVIGQPGVNPASSSRGGMFFDGNNFFFAGIVTTPNGNRNGIAQIDPATGAQIGQGVEVGFSTIQTATLHRGELFMIYRATLGKGGGNNAAARLLVGDRTTGEIEFLNFIPIYINGLASGDL